jgi:hypothetical protein
MIPYPWLLIYLPAAFPCPSRDNCGSSTKVLPRDAVKRRASPADDDDDDTKPITRISQVGISPHLCHLTWEACRIHSPNSQNAELSDSSMKEFGGFREVFGLD